MSGAVVIPFPGRRSADESPEAVILTESRRVQAAALEAPGPALNLLSIELALSAAAPAEATTRGFAAAEVLLDALRTAPRVELETGATFAVVPLET